MALTELLSLDDALLERSSDSLSALLLVSVCMSGKEGWISGCRARGARTERGWGLTISCSVKESVSDLDRVVHSLGSVLAGDLPEALADLRVPAEERNEGSRKGASVRSR